MRKTLIALLKRAPSILKFCFGIFFAVVLSLMLIVDKRDFIIPPKTK